MFKKLSIFIIMLFSLTSCFNNNDEDENVNNSIDSNEVNNTIDNSTEGAIIVNTNENVSPLGELDNANSGSLEITGGFNN